MKKSFEQQFLKEMKETIINKWLTELNVCIRVKI